MSKRFTLFLFIALCTTPAWAGDTVLGKYLAALHGPDAAAATEAAARMGTGSFSGYEIETEHALILAALADPRLWVKEAALRCLNRGSAWKKKELTEALIAVLEGTNPTTDPSLAVRPLITRLDASQRLSAVRTAFSGNDEKVQLAFLAQAKKVKTELRDPATHLRLLQLLQHPNEELAMAALTALFEMMGTADHGDVALIAEHITSACCESVRTQAPVLFLKVAPRNEAARAEVLTALGELKAKQAKQSPEAKLSAALIKHFKAVTPILKETEPKPPKPASCPNEVGKRTFRDKFKF